MHVVSVFNLTLLESLSAAIVETKSSFFIVEHNFPPQRARKKENGLANDQTFFGNTWKMPPPFEEWPMIWSALGCV